MGYFQMTVFESMKIAKVCPVYTLKRREVGLNRSCEKSFSVGNKLVPTFLAARESKGSLIYKISMVGKMVRKNKIIRGT